MLHDWQCTFSHPGWLNTFQSPHTVYFAVRIRLPLSLYFLFASSARPSLPSSGFFSPSVVHCWRSCQQDILPLIYRNIKRQTLVVMLHSCRHSFSLYPVGVTLWHWYFFGVVTKHIIMVCRSGQVGILKLVVFRLLFTEDFNPERFIILTLDSFWNLCHLFCSLAFSIVLENMENCMWEHYLTTVNVIFLNVSETWTFCKNISGNTLFSQCFCAGKVPSTIFWKLNGRPTLVSHSNF